MSDIFDKPKSDSNFCLVLAIFRPLDQGDIDLSTARDWYELYWLKAMPYINIFDVAAITRTLPLDSTAYGRPLAVCDPTNKVGTHVKPIAVADIAHMFGTMVRKKWHFEARDFLEQFVLNSLQHGTPDHPFTDFWFPLLGELRKEQRRLRREGDLKHQPLAGVYNKAMFTILVVYAWRCVGREPKCGPRRPVLSPGCLCSSYLLINRFLGDRYRTKQLFPLAPAAVKFKIGQPRISVVRSELSGHIAQQLRDPRRGCFFHVHKSPIAGEVLVLRKENVDWEVWKNWLHRMEEGKGQMHRVITGHVTRLVFRNFGNVHYWTRLRFLEQHESEWKIPFVFEEDQEKNEDHQRRLTAFLNRIDGRFRPTYKPTSHFGPVETKQRLRMAEITLQWRDSKQS